MNFDDIPRRFANHFGTDSTAYALYPGATSQTVTETESRIGHALPGDISKFFSRFNGLSTNAPDVELWALERWTIDDSRRIAFALVDPTFPLYFDCTANNDAGQWDILGPDAAFRITRTFASLCTVHLWKWIDRRIPFWQPDWLDYAQSRKTYKSG